MKFCENCPELYFNLTAKHENLKECLGAFKKFIKLHKQGKLNENLENEYIKFIKEVAGDARNFSKTHLDRLSIKIGSIDKYNEKYLGRADKKTSYCDKYKHLGCGSLENSDLFSGLETLKKNKPSPRQSSSSIIRPLKSPNQSEIPVESLFRESEILVEEARNQKRPVSTCNNNMSLSLRNEY
jgi:hypothetical protein